MMDIQVIDAVTPITISKEDMTRAVQDFVGSTTFIKSLVPLSAINIIKHRIDYDEETFDNHTINGERYVTVKALVSEDNPMYKFHINLRSAMKLVNDQYLVSLNACIKRKGTEEVIEDYRFNIKYLEDNNKEHSKTELKIAETASKMLWNINYLKRQVKLKAEDVSLELQLSLNEGFSKDYVKKHFESAKRDIEANNKGKHTLYENITSTSLSTKFNKDVESNKRSSYGEGSSRQFEMLDYNLDNCFDSIAINCPCKVICYFEDVPLIRCRMCHAHSHLPCLGFKSLRSLLKPLLCLKCSKEVGIEYIDRRGNTFKKEKDFIALVQARLMIYFVLYCKRSVNDLIKKLPKEDVKYFIYKMNEMNILYFINNQYTVDMNFIEKKASIQFFNREYKRAPKKEIQVDKMVMKRKNLETKENESKKTKTLDTHTTINN